MCLRPLPRRSHRLAHPTLNELTGATTLLLAGVAAAIVFAAVLLVEGARRPGYDPIYHTGSELDLGEWGWVQRANFLLMGLGVFAYAVGVNRAIEH